MSETIKARLLTLLYTFFIPVILVLLSLNTYAQNKVVVIPMGDTCTTESCGLNLHEPCSEGVGMCERAGIMVCNDDLIGARCSATPGSPVSEICNGLDDDCDGSTDEDFPDLSQLCVVGVGACQAVGNFICDDFDPSGNPVCSATPSPPTVEVCNALDDDCDGETDENIPVHQPCPLQVGVCNGSVSPVCDAGQWVSCSAIDYGHDYQAMESMCDGLDNDCDGETDEGCIDADLDGYYSLASGGLDCDDDNKFVNPGASEICDAIDNDCDTQIDEAGAESSCVGLADPCNAGICLDGQCEVIPLVGDSCSDNEVCTLFDMCTVEGRCTGTWDEINCGLPQ